MIKVLPSHISNLIAAGEVVQRPSSVVKELMENSVDANAQSISVIIGDSGRTLIQVIDDGTGFSPEDAKKAFLRHATSKISEAEDLNRIATLGFRGEALASICSVAEVTLRTRREEDETGYEVKFAESRLISEEVVSTSAGSNFIVRNLFYNIPARRKFLKSDATEFRQILSEFSRIAITCPELHFRLVHNGNDIYRLSPAPLKKRIQDVAGKEMGKELVHISLQTSIINIQGYIGRPEDARKTPGNQYLFVNNRFFRSAYFQKAIIKGYSGLIPEGSLPSFFIFLKADPSNIDVNIHPSKTEIKFEEDYAIFDILHSVVRESLGKNSFIPSIDFDQEGAPEIPKVNTNFYAPPPKIDYDPLFNPFKRENEKFFSESAEQAVLDYKESLSVPFIFSDSRIGPKPVLQYSSKYLITTIKSGVVFIDTHRALERILYEKYLDMLVEQNRIAQHSLFPIYLEPGVETLSILKENEVVLAMIGFNITFEENSLTINAMPEGFSADAGSVGELLDNLIVMLSEDGRDFDKRGKERLAAQLATSGSSRKSESLNNTEAQAFIDSLFACREPDFTPAGKPCLTVISYDEIEKRLK